MIISFCIIKILLEYQSGVKLFIYDNYYFIILSIFTNIFPFSETKIYLFSIHINANTNRKILREETCRIKSEWMRNELDEHRKTANGVLWRR